MLICNELRKHLQETLIEIINVKDSRKNELVECNKDLTRLQMSMKPLFIYANNSAKEREEVKEFISFYLKNAKNLVADVGYIPLTDEEYDLEINKFNEFIK